MYYNINLKLKTMKKTKLEKARKLKENLENRLNTNKFELTSNKRLCKINKKIFELEGIKRDELFYSKILQQLTPTAYTQNEIEYYKNEIELARAGDDDAFHLLNNQFKFNKDFKKQTGVFANV